MIQILLRENSRMQLRNHPVQILLLPQPRRQGSKSVIAPEDAPVFQRDRIGHGKLFEQGVLDPLILCRELDQISQDQGAVVEIKTSRNGQIDQDKYRHH